MGLTIFINRISQYPWVIFLVSLICFSLFSLEDKFYEVTIIENQLNHQQKILNRHKALLNNRKAYSRQVMTLKESQQTMKNYFGKKNYTTIRGLLNQLAPEMAFNHIKNYQETSFWDNDIQLTRFEGKIVGSLSEVRGVLWELSTSGNLLGPFIRSVSIKLNSKENEVSLLFVFDVFGYGDEN